MMEDDDDILRQRMRQRLGRLLDIEPARCDQITEEVLDLFDETIEDFIADRHLELQRQGWRNREIYPQIQRELARWRFRAPPLSLRQIRRRIYD